MQATAESAKSGRRGTELGRRIVAATAVAVATIALLAAWIDSAVKSRYLGWDFSVFYTAARIPLSQLYNPAALSMFWQQHLQPIGVERWAPYIRPSVFALVSRPLGMLPYGEAFLVWLIAGFCAFVASIAILIHRFNLPGYMVLVFCGFYPTMAGLVSGQDNCLFLLVILGGWLLLLSNREWLAGAVLGCCLYKYNLMLLVPLLLIFKHRFRALTSFTVVGGLLAAFSVVLASPNQYFSLLMNIRKLVPESSPVSLFGTAHVGSLPWLYPLSAAVVLIATFWLMVRLPLTEALCIALIGTLLVSPYVAWYDSTLLMLPIAAVLARAGLAVRLICLASMIIQPLWRNSGGSIDITYSLAGLFLLAYFTVRELRTPGRCGGLVNSASPPGRARAGSDLSEVALRKTDWQGESGYRL
jgi:hypothetical protein